MNKALLPYVGAGALVALMAVYASHLQNAQAADAPPSTPDIKVAVNQLKYPPGSPQLAYLHIDTLHAEAPPVLEPLPGRITLDEDHTVRVFSPVAGKVVQIVAEPGQTVKAGEVLAWVTAPDYDAAVADLRKAQADHDGKQAALDRSARLHEAGVIATRELEQARTEARSAQAELERASARVRELGAGTQASPGRFALKAPIAGVVAERHLNPGQELRPDAADPAFTITDLSHLDAVADVSEGDVGKLHVGQSVRVETQNLDAPLEGRISHIGVVMDPSIRRIPVRVHLLKPSASTRPETFVRLIPVDTSLPLAVAVPNSAIVTTGQQSFVFVEGAPGRLFKTPVTLAARGREVSHIAQGVQSGARVVTQGAILLDAELGADHGS